MESLEFILTRARATRDVQDTLKGTWVWKKMTLQDWNDRIDAFEAQSETATHAETQAVLGRSTLDADLATLARQTIRARAIARAELADEPEKLGLVKRSKDLGDSREADLQEALEWLSIWEQLDPAWSPAPGMTLESFKALYDGCLSLRQTFETARAAWVAAAERLMDQARQLDRCSVDWYAVATQVFAEGTYEGDLIRRMVPTTYVPPAAAGSSAPSSSSTGSSASTPATGGVAAEGGESASGAVSP